MVSALYFVVSIHVYLCGANRATTPQTEKSRNYQDSKVGTWYLAADRDSGHKKFSAPTSLLQTAVRYADRWIVAER